MMLHFQKFSSQSSLTTTTSSPTTSSSRLFKKKHHQIQVFIFELNLLIEFKFQKFCQIKLTEKKLCSC